MATAALSLGLLDEAEQLINDALAMNQLYPRSFLVLGHIKILRNRPEDALAPLQEALRLDSNYARAHYELAFALNRLGNKTGARTHMDVAAELQPGNYAKAAAELGIRSWAQKATDSVATQQQPTGGVATGVAFGASDSDSHNPRNTAPQGRRRRKRGAALQRNKQTISPSV